MDFEFPSDSLMLRDMLRKFVQKEARPLEMSYFNNGDLKPEEWSRLRRSIEQLGLWGLMVPEKFGGGGLDLVTSCLIEEELGGTFIPLEIGNLPPILYACQGEQVRQYLEPAIEGSRRPILALREPGSSGIHPESWMTIVTPAGDNFRLDGQKLLSTRPQNGDFIIAIARHEEDHPTQDKANGYSAFLLELDTPGLNIVNYPAQYTGVLLEIKGCNVEHQSLLGEPGNALKLSKEESYRTWIQTGARYVGFVERLIEMATEHARDWVSLGASLSVRPAIQRMLAEMRVDVESVRWLVYHAAWLFDTQTGSQTLNTAAQVRLASGEMLRRAVNHTTMIFTGPGGSPQIDLEWIVHSMVPMEALDVALEHARAIIANQMLTPSEG